MSLVERIIVFYTSLFLLVALTIPTVGNTKDLKQDKCNSHYDRTSPTDDELKKILTDHREWLSYWNTDRNRAEVFLDKRRANLCGADLRGVDLRGVDLREADLRGIDLSEAQLYGADLRGVDLSEAQLYGADLRGVHLSEASLYKAILLRADLNGASLSAADLSAANLREANLHQAYLVDAIFNGADLSRADLGWANLREANLNGASLFSAEVSGAIFEPQLPYDVYGLIGVTGLSSISFERVDIVVELRKKFKEAGFQTEEKALTSALRKSYLSRAPLLDQVKWRILFGGLLTDFGAKPVGPLVTLMALVLVFVWPYLLAIWKARDGTGIWRIRPEDRLLKVENEVDQEIIRWRGLWRSMAVALYFSFLSAFHFGWRNLNVANWVVRVQKREYVLQPTGWVRTVSGVQSLISLYLVVLWMLASFGDIYA